MKMITQMILHSIALKELRTRILGLKFNENNYKLKLMIFSTWITIKL